MVTLAGTSWPFDRASEHLAEFCHLKVSDDVIERVCQEQGESAKRWMEQSSEPVKAFAKAAGDIEFSTDGVKINTTGGWREMRLSVLAKRQPIAAAGPDQWDKRVLNRPSVRLASCAIANADRVGASWQRLSKRMGLGQEPMSVIADGAKWIWRQASRRLSPRADWCVDVYHVAQHLHACGKALLGEGAAARAWADQHLMRLLNSNGPELIRHLQNERPAWPAAPHQAAMNRLLNYLSGNRDSLWYRRRLQAGLPIGSGLIEGGCKNTIGARLKANSARWRIRRAERIGHLRCLDSSGLWQQYWESKAA